jgi:succinate dehydrogenase hydrophobic anchor subunit
VKQLRKWLAWSIVAVCLCVLVSGVVYLCWVDRSFRYIMLLCAALAWAIFEVC